MINLEDWSDYQRSYDLVNFCIDENQRSKNETFLLNSVKLPKSASKLVISGFKLNLQRGSFVDGDREYVEDLLFYIGDSTKHAQTPNTTSN